MVHKYTNPVRVTGTTVDKYRTMCGEVVERYQCVASDFKTTCEKCVRAIIALREKELELLKEKLPKKETWEHLELKP